MRAPTPALRSLALRLIEHETGADAGPEDLALGAEQICRKFSSQLEPLIGATGFQLLLARALRLAGSGIPLPIGLESGTTANLAQAGLHEHVRGREPAEVHEAVTAIIAQLLALLANFIGEDLAVRLVSGAWPDLPPGNADSASDREMV